MALIGYARVSTHGQKDDTQVDDLTAAGCAKIFTDHGVSGKLAKRPELDKCLAYMRDGEDTLVITRLSRAMRSLHHMLVMVNGEGGLRDRGLGLKVLKQDIDTSTATGRFLFHILAAVDELQRENIVEGTVEGLAAARARGRTGGRKPKLSPAQAGTLHTMYDAKDEDGRRLHTVKEIADALQIDRTTVYDYLKRDAEASSE